MTIFFLLQVKRKLEELLMRPFVQYGKRLGKKRPLEDQYDLFCFFSGYALGGAEKVHADITACFPDKKIIIFFTRTSANNKMLHLFQHDHITIRDISRGTDNKWIYWNNFIWRGRCASYINNQKKPPVVFVGQCNFGYKLLPHLDQSVKKTELIHVAEKKFSRITFPFLEFIDKRIMIADAIIERAKKYYRAIGVPKEWQERIIKIINKTEIPVDVPEKKHSENLKICYAGRGGYPKRIYLIARIVQSCQKKNIPAEFHFAGDFEKEIPGEIKEFVTFHGMIPGGKEMNAFYRQMDVLLMTSASEAFPMLIMEAMANGVVPVSTAVGGIPEHVNHFKNGILISTEDEKHIVEEAVIRIEYLYDHRDELKRMSQQARQYAAENFSKEKFCTAYRKTLFGD